VKKEKTGTKIVGWGYDLFAGFATLYPVRTWDVRSSRMFVIGSVIGADVAVCCLVAFLPVSALAQRSEKRDHYATGEKVGVAATSLQAAEAALWALDQGGNAAAREILA